MPSELVACDGLPTTSEALPTASAARALRRFVLEENQRLSDKKEVPTPQASRIYAMDPQTGSMLRPPLMPPFASNDKKKGVLCGIGVFHGCLYATSGYGCVLALPRNETAGGV